MPDVAPHRARAFRAPTRPAATLHPTVLLGACGGADGATGPGGVAGVYALQSVNGELPMLCAETEGLAAYVASGAVELRTDGRYTSTLTFRFTAGGRSESQSEQDRGRYTVSGASVTLRSDAGGCTAAAVRGGRLTSLVPLAEGGALAFEFQK